jgi:cytosine/adenosine deaminase-related metal-dependent hydrolase
MRDSGCRIAMGLDGMALDEDDDALREMRLTGALHRGWGFESDWTDSQLWRFASSTGRRSVLGAAKDLAEPGGELSPGHAADFLMLDLDRVDDDRDLMPGVDPVASLMARGRADAIRGVFARGRPVVVDGQVTGIDEFAVREALHRQTREAMAEDPGWSRWRETLEHFHEDLGPFYRQRQFLACC